MQPPENPPSAQTPRDWILVVDDEQEINNLIITTLTTDRLEVVTAGNADEAFAALDQHTTEPVLVLTDVLMPGMDGLNLARKLSSRLTRSKIVIMSGHLTDLSWWPADLRELVFLAKPFRTSEISSLVEIALTGFNRGS